MFQGTFRNVHARFDASQFAAWVAPRKPRHPLMRVGVALLGLALLAVLVVVGLFVGAAMLAGGLVARLLARRGRRAAPDGALDVEYRVVPRTALPR
jgi:uncharacterized membrane protein YjgN (DUF898 family)